MHRQSDRNLRPVSLPALSISNPDVVYAMRKSIAAYTGLHWAFIITELGTVELDGANSTEGRANFETLPGAC